jgi:hypothetical protein
MIKKLLFLFTMIFSYWFNTSYGQNIKNYYEKIIESLSPQMIKSTKDIKNWPVFNSFYEIVYLYPNFFFNYGVSFNYYELIQQTAKKKPIIQQLITGLLQLKIIDLLYQITINNFMRFHDGQAFNPSEEEKSFNERRQFLTKCWSVFLDNWFWDHWDIQEFFQDVALIQEQFNHQDKIFIYYSIINNDFSVLQNVVIKNQKVQDLLKFKHFCIFFPLLQTKYDGQYPGFLLYKVTYPSRPNYAIIKDKFSHQNHHDPYLFCHRYVATQIYKSVAIDQCNLKEYILKTLNLSPEEASNLSDSHGLLKKKILEQMKDLNENLQWLLIFYVFFKKTQDPQLLQEYGEKIYWLLCRYYGETVHQQWIKEQSEKSR